MHNSLRGLIWLNACLLACIAVKGQTITFKQYGINDGLGHSIVYRIYQQDQKGFLWFGTDHGISRFDGKRFTTFTKPGKNSVLSISDYTPDTLLVNFYREGLWSLYQGTIQPLHLISKEQPESHRTLIKVLKESDQKFWMLSHSHLFKLDHGVNTLIKPLDSSAYKTIAIHPKYGLLVGTTKGLFSYKDDKLTPLFPSIIRHSRVENIIATDNLITFVADRKIYRIENDHLLQIAELPNKGTVSTLLVDRNETIWIADPTNGLLKYQDGHLQNMTSYFGLQNTLVNDIKEDHEGNVWLATYGQGVIRISFKTNLWINQQPLSYVRALYQRADGKVLIGSMGQIKIFDPVKPGLKHVQDLREDELVYQIAEFSDGRTVAGTPFRLVDIYKPAPFSVSRWGWLCFKQIAPDSLLLGGYEGIAKISLSTEAVTPVPIAPPNRINHIFFDNNTGRQWYATDEGIYTTNKDSVIHYNTENGLPDNNVNSICSDKQGRIWAATNAGLQIISTDSIWIINQENGLLHSKCNVVVPDHKGGIWVGTLKGLCYVDSACHVQRLGSVYDLTASEILSLIVLRDGGLLVGTTDRLVMLKAPYSTPQIGPPNTYITDWTINESYSSLYSSPTVAYGKNRILIGFKSASIQYADYVQYEYKLEGYTNQWTNTRNTSVDYQALPPGKYTFMVRAKHDFSSELSPISSISFSVAKPYWMKWWFILLVTTSTLGLLYLLILYRVKTVRRKHQYELSIQRTMTELKHQALNAMMNPHFIYNVLHSMQQYVRHHTAKESDEYINHFSELIRLNLNYSEHTLIPLEDELERLKRYVEIEQKRVHSPFEYTVTVDQEVDLEEIEIPNMVLQPYIENAIWHGLQGSAKKGLIKIAITSLSFNQLEITIEDNGSGIEESQKMKQENDHESMGMRLTEQRLQLVNENNHVSTEQLYHHQTGEVTGTRITLLLWV